MRFNVGDILRRKKEFSNGRKILAIYKGETSIGMRLELLQEFSGCPKGTNFYGNADYWELDVELSKEELICRKIKSMYAKRKELGYRF